MCQRLQDLYYRYSGEQDTWGRAEAAVRDVPSPWDVRPCLLPPTRTNSRTFAVGKLDWLAKNINRHVRVPESRMVLTRGIRGVQVHICQT